MNKTVFQFYGKLFLSLLVAFSQSLLCGKHAVKMNKSICDRFMPNEEAVMPQQLNNLPTRKLLFVLEGSTL